MYNIYRLDGVLHWIDKKFDDVIIKAYKIEL